MSRWCLEGCPEQFPSLLVEMRLVARPLAVNVKSTRRKRHVHVQACKLAHKAENRKSESVETATHFPN